MFKKLLLLLSITATLTFTNFAYAEHSENDPYEAMCQSTGPYFDTKHPYNNLLKNKLARVMQLFGACGEKPNILIVDETFVLKNATPSVYRHNITVWESPQKSEFYWKPVYTRFYNVDKEGKIIKTWQDSPDKTSFINVLVEHPLSLTIKRYCSAKVGSPIFPDAQGDLLCQSGAEFLDFLEQGHRDYLHDMKKK